MEKRPSGEVSPKKKKNKGSERRRQMVKRMKVLFILFAVSFCLTALVGIAALVSKWITPQVDGNAVLADSITIDGIAVGGKTFAQARKLLLEDDLSGVCVTVSNGEMDFAVYPSDFGVTANISDTLRAAVQYGDTSKHDDKLKADGIVKDGAEYTTTLKYDEKKAAACIAKMHSYLDKAVIEPYAAPDKNSNKPEFLYYDGKDGSTIDDENMISAILNGFSERTSGLVIEPVYTAVARTRTKESVKENTKLYSKFQTEYSSGSLKAKERIFNIRKTAKLLNGCVVKAGEEFSFNDFIGPRTIDGGWLSAPGIVNGNTYVMQPGGGICQVSTTLHNAIICAGPEFEITTRKNHSWPSSYASYGLDATVSMGGPDYKFVNNTGSDVYIFAYADNVNYVMTIYIYGKGLEDGVSYKSRATTDEVIDPAATVTIEEPTWPTGFRYTEISSRKGYKTTAYRDKIVNGKVVESKVLYKGYYKPKQGTVHVGTGDPSLPKPVIDN